MLVVAADEGWLPQSAEHLAALDALGVERGVLVITKIDRADPTVATAEARSALAGTRWPGSPRCTSAPTTAAGSTIWSQLLGRVLAELPDPDPSAPARLWVDRSFSITGAGQVITGTLPAGRIRVGEELATRQRCSAPGARHRVARAPDRRGGRDRPSGSERTNPRSGWHRWRLRSSRAGTGGVQPSRVRCGHGHRRCAAWLRRADWAVGGPPHRIRSGPVSRPAPRRSPRTAHAC